MSPRPPARRALAALSLFGCACLLVAACSGDGDAGAPSTTSTTAGVLDSLCADGIGPLCVPTYSNPQVPVQVDVGRRFAILLPADPAHGWRWVVDPTDTSVLAPLGSEFREDPVLLAKSTTTTTTTPPPPPPPDQPDGDGNGAPPSSESTTTTTTVPPSTTATTAPGPLVQVVSYAGRSPGLADVTLRYERIGADEPGEVVTFQVLVGTPPVIEPPPADEATTTTG
jgi:predicted secreted protein